MRRRALVLHRERPAPKEADFSPHVRLAAEFIMQSACRSEQVLAFGYNPEATEAFRYQGCAVESVIELF